MNPDDDRTTTDLPAPLLPLLSLPEAHALLPLLAAVADGGMPDREAAAWLLSNLAARVPSREVEQPVEEGLARLSKRGRAIAAMLGQAPRRPLGDPDAR